jgi:hypothetical protein
MMGSVNGPLGFFGGPQKNIFRVANRRRDSKHAVFPQITYSKSEFFFKFLNSSTKLKLETYTNERTCQGVFNHSTLNLL